jgi:hypothetical protein
MRVDPLKQLLLVPEFAVVIHALRTDLPRRGGGSGIIARRGRCGSSNCSGQATLSRRAGCAAMDSW